MNPVRWKRGETDGEGQRGTASEGIADWKDAERDGEALRRRERLIGNPGERDELVERWRE